MVAICWIKVRKDTDLNLSVLENRAAFDIQLRVFVTQSIQLLDSQLSPELVKDDDIMIVWVEANPVIIVRAYEGPTSGQYLVHYCRLTCIGRSVYPSVFALLRWIEWIVIGTCRYLFQLLFFL